MRKERKGERREVTKERGKGGEGGRREDTFEKRKGGGKEEGWETKGR